MKRTMIGLLATTLIAGLTIACNDTPAPKATATATAAGTTATAAATTPAAAKATAAATTPAPAATTPAAAAAPSTIAVTAVEVGDKYSFDPATFTVKAGEITVKLTNKAGNERPHTFFVKNAAGTEIAKSDGVQPGASADVKFTIADAGAYQIYCNIMGHVDRGQTGTMTVTR